MRKLTLSSSLLVLAAVAVGYTNAGQSRQGPLEGAWKWVGEQPSLFLFTEGHYSMMFIMRPRELFADPANVTDAEWLQACRGFGAGSGTYEIVGSVVRIKRIVSRNPNIMAMGMETTFEYSITGDTLRMDPGRGPGLTLVRLR